MVKTHCIGIGQKKGVVCYDGVNAFDADVTSLGVGFRAPVCTRTDLKGRNAILEERASG